MVIESIADNLHLIETIGRWHWEEWGHVDTEGSLEDWTARLAERVLRDKIPTSYVALSEERELLGSVTLVDCDMHTCPDLWPWLAGLFVHPDARDRGVGSSLALHAMERVRVMGIGKLYLYTAPAEEFYKRLGWRVIAREIYDGSHVAVMEANVA